MGTLNSCCSFPRPLWRKTPSGLEIPMIPRAEGAVLSHFPPKDLGNPWLRSRIWGRSPFALILFTPLLSPFQTTYSLPSLTLINHGNRQTSSRGRVGRSAGGGGGTNRTHFFVHGEEGNMWVLPPPPRVSKPDHILQERVRGREGKRGRGSLFPLVAIH